MVTPFSFNQISSSHEMQTEDKNSLAAHAQPRQFDVLSSDRISNSMRPDSMRKTQPQETKDGLKADPSIEE